MNIGFDLDGIFVKGPPFVPKILIERLYKEKDNGVLLYRIPGTFEQAFRKVTHSSILRPSINKNLAFLQTLAKEKQYNLYLITSRFGFLQRQTEQIAKKHHFDSIFKKLYLNYNNEQPHEFKNRIMKELGIERYIDDDFSLIRYLAKHNPKILFYWLNSHQQKQITENIFAITNISAITK